MTQKEPRFKGDVTAQRSKTMSKIKGKDTSIELVLFTFFPSSTENPYMHVRPHAKDRNDTNELPVADKLTGLVQCPKHSFWLNRSYVLKIISREGR